MITNLTAAVFWSYKLHIKTRRRSWECISPPSEVI